MLPPRLAAIPVFTQLAVASQSTIAGTTEYLECAGRGICDRSVGTCKCFPGFGSDDGMGNGGTLPYCGYRLPYVVADTSKYEPWERDTGATHRLEREVRTARSSLRPLHKRPFA